jgi:hypothetical protein
LKKDIESWKGGWIIINDRSFSTPNKENDSFQREQLALWKERNHTIV